MALWASKLCATEIIRIRLCYTKHQRHHVAHEVIAGPLHEHLSFIRWLKIVVLLGVRRGEALTVDSPLLVRAAKSKLMPMTGVFMGMDKIYSPVLGWYKATIHSRRRGFATAAVRRGIHMASISIAMRHSQGVTLQYVSLSLAEKASITTRVAIAAYDEKDHKRGLLYNNVL